MKNIADCFEKNHTSFLKRHLGPNADQEERMLHYLKLSSSRELIRKVVPEDILEEDIELDFPKILNEKELLVEAKSLSEENSSFINFWNVNIFRLVTKNDM